LLVIGDLLAEVALPHELVAHFVDGSGDGDELRGDADFTLYLALAQISELPPHLFEALIRIAPQAAELGAQGADFVADLDEHFRR
jgi:hypothetical protein